MMGKRVWIHPVKQISLLHLLNPHLAPTFGAMICYPISDTRFADIRK